MNELTAAAGEVVRLVFSVADNVVPGEYEINLTNMECAHSTSVLSTYGEQTAKLTVEMPTGIESMTSTVLSGPTSIYTTDGKRVKMVDCDGVAPLEHYLSDLASGVYVVANSDRTYKVVKN